MVRTKHVLFNWLQYIACKTTTNTCARRKVGFQDAKCNVNARCWVSLWILDAIASKMKYVTLSVTLILNPIFSHFGLAILSFNMMSNARCHDCETLWLRDIVIARHCDCETLWLRDIAIARSHYCQMSWLRDIVRCCD